MPPLWPTLCEKCKMLTLQVLTIVLDCAFVILWWIFQHGVKLAFGKIAVYFGKEYAVEGREHWLVETGHLTTAGATLIAICLVLVTDLSKLALYCYDEVCSVVSEIRAKQIQRRGGMVPAIPNENP